MYYGTKDLLNFLHKLLKDIFLYKGKVKGVIKMFLFGRLSPVNLELQRFMYNKGMKIVSTDSPLCIQIRENKFLCFYVKTGLIIKDKPIQYDVFFDEVVNGLSNMRRIANCSILPDSGRIDWFSETRNKYLKRKEINLIADSFKELVKSANKEITHIKARYATGEGILYYSRKMGI